MPVSIRNGLLMVLLALMPAGVDAGLLAPWNCGGCGQRPWIGFTFGIPLLTPCDFGLCCPPPCGGCGPGFGGYGPTYPPPLSYGYGAAPYCDDCGITAPPITTVPPITSPPIEHSAPLLPPAGVGPSLHGPTSYAPNPCAQPVCQTTLQPQQYTTYHNVPTVQYRREAYTENVPVTTYQPQTRYRDVAYTVNRQVAQTHTRYVPQTHVSYAPQYPVATAPCRTCDQSTAYGVSPQFASPAPYSTSYSGLPVYESASATAEVPTPIALPQTPAATLQQPEQTSSAEQDWQTVPQRHAQNDSGVQQMGAWTRSAEPRRLSPHRSMFQPAPSAASVWQSRWMR